MNIGLFDAGYMRLVSFFLEPCADLLWFAPKPCAVESYVLQGLLNGPLCSWHWTVGEEFLKSHKQVHKQGMFILKNAVVFFFFSFFWHFFKYYLVTALCWLDMDAKAKESVRKIIAKNRENIVRFLEITVSPTSFYSYPAVHMYIPMQSNVNFFSSAITKIASHLQWLLLYSIFSPQVKMKFILLQTVIDYI